MEAGMNDLWIPLAFVFIGWLLGVLSPAMIEIIRRKRDLPLLKNAIRSDLSELRLILALSAVNLKAAQGLTDRRLLEWQQDVLASYRGKSGNPPMQLGV
jgi:hypothetical protein